MSDPSDFCIGCMNDDYPEGLRKEIESLRQQLAESQTKLVECQAREKVRAEALTKVQRAICLAADLDPLGVIGRLYNEISPAAELPSDSTALDSAIKQEKREALQSAIAEWEKPYGMTDGSKFIDRLIRMADKFKLNYPLHFCAGCIE